MYYKSLFNINIHHGYFLDKGNDKYLPIDLVNDVKMLPEDKNKALKEYDFSEFLNIIPTPFTQRIFKNHKMVFRKNAKGFTVLVNTKELKPLIPFNNAITFTFALQATDPYFLNYTNVDTLLKNELYLFTNVVPGNLVDFENIFENNGGAIDTRFALDATETRNLIKEIAAEDASFFATSNPFSIANAIQLINTDITLENNQAKKDEKIAEVLDKAILIKKQQNILGYVRLTIKGTATEQDLLTYLNNEQFVKELYPNFTISFVNRKTKWRFFSAIDNKIFITKEEKWLSKNGFTEIIGKPPDNLTLTDLTPEPDKEYVFPNPTVESITTEEGGTVEENKYYSEIFI